MAGDEKKPEEKTIFSVLKNPEEKKEQEKKKQEKKKFSYKKTVIRATRGVYKGAIKGLALFVVAMLAVCTKISNKLFNMMAGDEKKPEEKKPEEKKAQEKKPEEKKPEEKTVYSVLKELFDKKVELMQKKFGKKRNIDSLIKWTVLFILAMLAVCTEISNQKLHAKLFNTNDAICEDLSEVNVTMYDIAVEALTSIREQGREKDIIRKDPDGAWLITADVNIGDLSAVDVAQFNKYINCTDKFAWLHPNNNKFSYWIEMETPKQHKQKQKEEREQKREKLLDQRTAQTAVKTGEGVTEELPAEKHRLPNKHKHRAQHGKVHFSKAKRRGVKHGDIRRVMFNANQTELKWEMIFNDNICLKSGNPHVCIYEDGAQVVYRARIQRSVPWFGSYKIGVISAAVIPGSEPGSNILRTKLALGGDDSRFISNSIATRAVNLAAVPIVRGYLYDEQLAADLQQHLLEESYIAASIMQYLHEPELGVAEN